MMKRFMVFGLIVFTIFMVACNAPQLGTTPTNTIGGDNTILAGSDFNVSGTQVLKKFNSLDEFRAFVEESSASSQDTRMYNSVAMESVKATSAPTATTGAMDSGTGDHSNTNIQVQGVDEADFVKNDGRYIYILNNNRLLIVDAYDAANAKIIFTKSFDDSYARNLYISNDTLVVFVDKGEQGIYLSQYDITPQQTYIQNTYVYIYNIANKQNPTLIDTYKISGYYYDSRLINNKLFVLTTQGLNVQYIDGPVIAYSKETIHPDIYYFDNPEQNYQLNNVVSIDIADNTLIDSKSFMMGYGDTVMVSENTLYITYQKSVRYCWMWRCNYNTDNKDRFMTVVVPLLQGDLKTQVDGIISLHLSDDDQWLKISKVFSDFYTKAQKDEPLQTQYEDMFLKIQSATDEYDTQKALENSKTIIQKIDISNGNINYIGKAEIDGRLLNQYSMDEYNGYLRAATTIDLWTNTGRKTYNNVYVLDSGLNIAGSLKNIAQNETIYSTRFIGDKLYMVTFRQIDPFFVIDLSNPANPAILGKLKIPGYSTYLHPIDSTHLIGIGKDVDEKVKGVKVSIYDVSDFSNPKEISNYIIGSQYTESNALYDPKAFLYSKSKDLLVLPISDNDYNAQTSWNGAYVFSTTDNEIKLLGTVKHSGSSNQYYYWLNSATVTRSLYMDDNLYTISDKYIKINHLYDLEALKSIQIGMDDVIPDPVPVPIR